MTRYEQAKEMYKALGVDTEKALETLKDVTVSVHCWQGDDVVGFDSKEALSGGIQTTGNYPGKANTPDELIADIYDFDGVLGKCSDYVYAHEYFYDNAFHLNDIGRAYRTYRVYLDLAELLGIESAEGFTECGTEFEGCIFEGTSGVPKIGVSYIN